MSTTILPGTSEGLELARRIRETRLIAERWFGWRNLVWKEKPERYPSGWWGEHPDKPEGTVQNRLGRYGEERPTQVYPDALCGLMPHTDEGVAWKLIRKMAGCGYKVSVDFFEQSHIVTVQRPGNRRDLDRMFVPVALAMNHDFGEAVVTVALQVENEQVTWEETQSDDGAEGILG
jgi:hypothetical protein